MTILETLDGNHAAPHFRIDDDDDDDDDFDEATDLVLDSEDETEEDALSSSNNSRMLPARPPRPTKSSRKSILPPPSASARRRRRRSSARFLRMTGRFDDSSGDASNGGTGPSDAAADDDPEDDADAPQSNLGELYKKAIRMNAENRINASNSWNLRLIENIDKFLMDDDNTTVPSSNKGAAPVANSSSSSMVDTLLTTEQAAMATTDPASRVNFTKASCTLDASVKIYSYRVDDVHLTSYKVLANLNRTGNDKEKPSSKNSSNSNASHDDDTEAPASQAARSRSKNANTLETNLGNINLNKLDSAFDIDPLFHKMSKTFDEGGAKGLLLANLGVGSEGCNIVFDSSCDKQETKVATAEPVEDGDEPTSAHRQEEGLMDITSLKSKLESLLSGSSVMSLQLVPQLVNLRADFQDLDAQGHVDHSAAPRLRRYAPNQDEEKEADRSIHQDAMERSRVSVGKSAQLGDADDDHDDSGSNVMPEAEFAADDFGGGFDDDDDDDGGFDNFMAADENGGRYSSISFNNSFAMEDPGPTAELLDAITDSANVNVLQAGTDYQYFDAAAFASLPVQDNVWAGASHWKRSAKRRPTVARASKATKKKKSKERVFCLLTETPDLTDILRQAPKRKSKADPLQLGKTTQAKHAKSDNLLPLDAGIGVEKLSALFLRPNTILKATGSANGVTTGSSVASKTVGFDMGAVETWGNESFGGGDDDDDGAGFCFADDNNDGIYELEDIRKVEKVRVGHATVAKKVDVKRLKRDLWVELETCFATKPQDDDVEQESESEETKEIDASMEEEEKEDHAKTDPHQCLSFQDAVQDLETAKSQADISLPFYFICVLHLANEKGLRLDSKGLNDFDIYQDENATEQLF